MTENEFRDTRLVWHCRNRHGEPCKQFYRCRGNNCRNYAPNPGSYYDLIKNRKGAANDRNVKHA